MSTIADLIDDPLLRRPAGAPEYAAAFATLSSSLTRAPSAHGQFSSSTWRDAGRKNASAASEAELQALIAERATLLLKRLNEGALSRDDADRLEYVRWSLDRIEDSRHGRTIDRLQSLVEAYKSELRDLQTLNTSLRAKLPQKRK